MNNRKNFKHLLFAAGIFFALFIFTSSFTACSSHILDIAEGLQSAPTPTSASAPIPAPTTYTVTVTSGNHGAISVDKTNAAAGETITITVTPEADYMLDVLTITDSNGNAIAISAAKTFTMPESDVTVSGTFKFARLVMLSGPSINSILDQNNVKSIVTKFIHSATPPETGIATYKLSADNSDVDVLAWLDGTTIKVYAEGYTDSNRKIPLNADSEFLFTSCYSLQVIDTEVFDTAAVTDMRSMFYGCENLTTLNLSGFDTSNVTDMGFMFVGCKKLETIVFSNKFLTSNVETMASMFSGCESLTSLDLSSFDTSKVTNMERMFIFDSSLTTIFVGDGFDTSNVTNSVNMFGSCQSLVGGDGTTYSYSNPEDKTYARIDGENSLPGYFTRK